jgi:hypothetical protein
MPTSIFHCIVVTLLFALFQSDEMPSEFFYLQDFAGERSVFLVSDFYLPQYLAGPTRSEALSSKCI